MIWSHDVAALQIKSKSNFHPHNKWFNTNSCEKALFSTVKVHIDYFSNSV